MIIFKQARVRVHRKLYYSVKNNRVKVAPNTTIGYRRFDFGTISSTNIAVIVVKFKFKSCYSRPFSKRDNLYVC